MTVWVLILTAVYDQGVYGVFSDKQKAIDYAEHLLDESDYHHTFRIERWTVDTRGGDLKRLVSPYGGERRPDAKRPTLYIVE